MPTEQSLAHSHSPYLRTNRPLAQLDGSRVLAYIFQTSLPSMPDRTNPHPSDAQEQSVFVVVNLSKRRALFAPRALFVGPRERTFDEA